MSFRLRLTISISLLLALTFGAGGALLISTAFYASLQDERTAAMHSYETVRSTLYLLNSVGEKTDYDHMTDTLSQMETQGIARWQALDLKSDEHFVYQSGESALFSADLPIPDSGQCSYAVVSDEYGSSLQVLSVIFAQQEQLLLRARFDLSSAYNARKTQHRLFFMVYIAVVLIGVLIAAAISFALTSRLKKLTSAVNLISSGNLSQRSNIRTRDEFGQLSRDFDAMADRLQQNIHQLEADVQRQESFMGAFAHELKTPMTSIIGYADLLRQGALDENDKSSAANYIFSEGQRLEKLSFKLLDLLLMEKDAPCMREVGLSSLLADVQQALAPVLKSKGIRLVCRSDQGKTTLEPDLVKSLLYNLIDNASKAIEGKEGLIAVKGTLTAEGCRLQVADSGRGMPQAELSRITEAFYRIDKSRSRQQGGAGLGLALCKKIVDLHHGSLKFNSTPGQGTCVTVELRSNPAAKSQLSE